MTDQKASHLLAAQLDWATQLGKVGGNEHRQHHELRDKGLETGGRARRLSAILAGAS